MPNPMVAMATNLYVAMSTKPTPSGKEPMSSEKAMKTVQNIFSALSGYVNSVVQYEITVPMLNFKYDREKFREQFERVDGNRNKDHSAAVRAVVQGNRLAEQYGVVSCFPDIDPVDAEDNPDARSRVADFCGEYVMRTFLERDGRKPVEMQTTLSMDQEPHLDYAVRAANRRAYTEKVPIKRRIPDISHLDAQTDTAKEIGA